MDNWFNKLTQWLFDLVKSVFDALLDFVHDAAFWLWDGVLSAFGSAVAAIPAPSFLSANGIGAILSGLPPFSLYVINKAGIATAFGIILAGVLFRLTRKALTLGQW